MWDTVWEVARSGKREAPMKVGHSLPRGGICAFGTAEAVDVVAVAVVVVVAVVAVAVAVVAGVSACRWDEGGVLTPLGCAVEGTVGAAGVCISAPEEEVGGGFVTPDRTLALELGTAHGVETEASVTGPPTEMHAPAPLSACTACPQDECITNVWTPDAPPPPGAGVCADGHGDSCGRLGGTATDDHPASAERVGDGGGGSSQ